MVARKSTIMGENIEISTDAENSGTIRKRKKTQARKSVGGHYMGGILNPDPNNKFLFENTRRFQHFVKDFVYRKIAGTYYFKEEDTDRVAESEMAEIEGYINY